MGENARKTNVWADDARGMSGGVGLALPDGLDSETVRRVEAAFKYMQRIEMPACSETSKPDWFWCSPRLQFLLSSCTMTGVNNPHVNGTLLLPEGRHLKLALIMRDCHAALHDSGVDIDFRLFSRIVLELHDAQSDQEHFAAGMFDTYLATAIPGFSLAGEGNPSSLHARIISHLNSRAYKAPASYDPARADELAGRIIEETEGQHVLLSALMRLVAFCWLAPYDIGNAFIGRMVYAQTLREGGMALLSYLPILDFIARWKAGKTLAPSYQPPVVWDSAVPLVHGARDMTVLFEEILRFVADDAWWFSNKLSRMAERRRRLEKLFVRDGVHNERQHAVLVEAYVHDDAEFTFDGLVDAYGVAYSTAHDDLCVLEREGFLVQMKSGRRAYFIATPDLQHRVRSHLRGCAPDSFDELFHEDGRLRGVPIEPWTNANALRPAVCLLDCSDDWRASFPRADKERRLLITKEHHR